MTGAVPNDLARALRAFFADHLPRVRGTSPHTIRSHRDSLVLLRCFVATRSQQSVIQLDLDDLGPQPVLAFLQHLELDRHNSATRNLRLAAIHAFFRYCAMEYPARLAHCQRVLAVPFKRTGSRPVEYLEHEEIEAVLDTVDRGTVDGRRDYALLPSFNTGARVQEIVALSVTDLRLDAPAQVRLHGKGRKERVCPLWPRPPTFCVPCWPSAATSRDPATTGNGRRGQESRRLAGPIRRIGHNSLPKFENQFGPFGFRGAFRAG